MWFPVLPQILVACIVLLAPGLIIAAALRFKLFDALAAAPALSVGVVVLASTAAPVAGVEFGILPVGVVAAVITGMAFWAGGRFQGPGTNGINAHGVGLVVPLAAFALAAALISWRILQVIGSPDAFSQTYDAVFHLNSVRYALDTGQASSLTLGGMTGGGFYPAGWNAVATLVAVVTGAGVTQAVNITSIVIASVFWPLSCMLMTRWIVGRSPAAAVAAGVSCASLGAFPLLMMDFGVLYPNLLAISILPACVAMAATLLGVGDASQPGGTRVALALLLCLTGLVVSHPTTFMAWLVWTLPMVAFLAYRARAGGWRFPQSHPARFPRRALALAGYSVVFIALWVFLRPPEEASFWGPYTTVPQAAGEALLVSPMGLAPAWLVAPLLFLGLYACCRRPDRHGWIPAAFALFAGIYVLVSGFPKSPLRNFVAGVWYNDSYRVAALLPVTAVLLTAVGMAWAENRYRVGALQPSVRTPSWRAAAHHALRIRPVQAAAALLALTVAVSLGQKGGVQQEAEQAASKYAISNEAPLVSADELALLRRLEKTVPVGATLVGNPYTGAALSYALGGRKATQLHILSYVSPELQKIHSDLGRVSSDPAVCEAVRNESAFFVLDFGTKEVHNGSHTPPGLQNLDSNPGVQLVDSQGDAKLYRISACGT